MISIFTVFTSYRDVEAKRVSISGTRKQRGNGSTHRDVGISGADCCPGTLGPALLPPFFAALQPMPDDPQEQWARVEIGPACKPGMVNQKPR